MKPIVGGTYQHYKGGLYMVTGFSTDEDSGDEQVLYTSLDNGVQYNQSTERFCEHVPDATRDGMEPRFRLKIPAEPSIGLPAVAYMWTDLTKGERMVTLPGDDEGLEGQPDMQREALVRLSDAFAKYQLERAQHLAAQLKNS